LRLKARAKRDATMGHTQTKSSRVPVIIGKKSVTQVTRFPLVAQKACRSENENPDSNKRKLDWGIPVTGVLRIV
jgi:hypothetical protein